MGVSEIKRRLIKKRPLFRMSFSMAVFIGVMIIFLCCSVTSLLHTVPENIVYLAMLSGMPDSMTEIIKTDFTRFLQQTGYIENDNDKIFQRDGTVNDIAVRRQFRDLTVTPDDIAENEAHLKQQYNELDYVSDGEVKEKTYISYQATDSFENVFVRNVTVDSQIDVQGIIENGCSLPAENIKDPLVLIYHTHSTESYIPFDNGSFSSSYPERNNDTAVNMIRVGEEIAAVLTARGIGVIHDTTIYDTVYTGAYDKSREGVTALLEKYPSVIITLDIHRDAIHYDEYSRVKPVAEIDGIKAAQLMIIAGAEGGNAENFSSWETNLSFALNLQKTVNTEYENLMKPVYFCNRKYNMDLTPYSLLIEVGTDMNTLSEAAYSARLLGDALAGFIKENAGA